MYAHRNAAATAAVRTISSLSCYRASGKTCLHKVPLAWGPPQGAHRRHPLTPCPPPAAPIPLNRICEGAKPERRGDRRQPRACQRTCFARQRQGRSIAPIHRLRSLSSRVSCTSKSLSQRVARIAGLHLCTLEAKHLKQIAISVPRRIHHDTRRRTSFHVRSRRRGIRRGSGCMHRQPSEEVPR